MKNYLIKKIEKENIEKYAEYVKEFPELVSLIPTLKDKGYFAKPSSIKYHGANIGGLFDHSLQVAKSLVDLTKNLNLKWLRPESPYIVGLFHDLCKCDNYRVDDTDRFIYDPEVIIPGHGDKSVIMLQDLITLTFEEIVCIRWHMGAYETDTKMWDYYGKAIEKYPNVLFTHTADMIASRIKGI